MPNENRSETEEDDLMIQQIEQMSRDMQARLESLKQDMTAFDQRLERLESGESETSSSDSADESAMRRKICDDFYNTYMVPTGDEDTNVDPEPIPLCRTCKHSLFYDGSIFQYRNNGSVPDYRYSAFIRCRALQGQMAIRSAPIRHCMLFEPDEGPQPQSPN